MTSIRDEVLDDARGRRLDLDRRRERDGVAVAHTPQLDVQRERRRRHVRGHGDRVERLVEPDAHRAEVDRAGRRRRSRPDRALVVERVRRLDRVRRVVEDVRGTLVREAEQPGVGVRPELESGEDVEAVVRVLEAAVLVTAQVRSRDRPGRVHEGTPRLDERVGRNRGERERLGLHEGAAGHAANRVHGGERGEEDAVRPPRREARVAVVLEVRDERQLGDQVAVDDDRLEGEVRRAGHLERVRRHRDRVHVVAERVDQRLVERHARDVGQVEAHEHHLGSAMSAAAARGEETARREGGGQRQGADDPIAHRMSSFEIREARAVSRRAGRSSRDDQ